MRCVIKIFNTENFMVWLPLSKRNTINMQMKNWQTIEKFINKLCNFFLFTNEFMCKSFILWALKIMYLCVMRMWSFSFEIDDGTITFLEPNQAPKRVKQPQNWDLIESKKLNNKHKKLAKTTANFILWWSFLNRNLKINK